MKRILIQSILYIALLAAVALALPGVNYNLIPWSHWPTVATYTEQRDTAWFDYTVNSATEAVHETVDVVRGDIRDTIHAWQAAVDGDILPSASMIRSIGSNSLRFKSIWAQDTVRAHALLIKKLRSNDGTEVCTVHVSLVPDLDVSRRLGDGMNRYVGLYTRFAQIDTIGSPLYPVSKAFATRVVGMDSLGKFGVNNGGSGSILIKTLGGALLFEADTFRFTTGHITTRQDMRFDNQGRAWWWGTDSSFIYQSGDRADIGMRHDGVNYVVASWYYNHWIFNQNVVVDGNRLIVTDATGADSASIWDDGDTTRFESDNPIKIGDASLIVEKGGDIRVSGALIGSSGMDVFARVDSLVERFDTTVFTPESYVEFYVGDTNTASVVNATGVAIGWGNYIDANAHQSYVMGYASQALGTHQTVLGQECIGGVDAKNATVGGGSGNHANAIGATVSGGTFNRAVEEWATVGGGNNNSAYGISSVIGGGESNTATGNNSVVPGGANNTAYGDYSFAFGRGVYVSGDYTAQFYTTNDMGLFRVAGLIDIVRDTMAWDGVRDSSGYNIARVETTCIGFAGFQPPLTAYQICGESGSGNRLASEFSLGEYLWLYHYDTEFNTVNDSFIVVVGEDKGENKFMAVADTFTTIDSDTVLIAQHGNSYFRNAHGFFSTWDSLAAGLINASTVYADSFTFAWAFGGEIDVEKLTSGDSLYIEGNFAHIPRLSNEGISIGSPSILTYFGVSAGHDTLYFDVQDGGVTVRFGVIPVTADTLP